MTNLPDIPVKWIEDKINRYMGMEHAMWKKLLRLWENEQIKNSVRNMNSDNRG